MVHCWNATQTCHPSCYIALKKDFFFFMTSTPQGVMLNVTAVRNVWRPSNSLLPLFQRPFIPRHWMRASRTCHWCALRFNRSSQMTSDPFRRDSVLEIKLPKPILVDNLAERSGSRDFSELLLFSSATEVSLCCFMLHISLFTLEIMCRR
jgi:hypothetical protein